MPLIAGDRFTFTWAGELEQLRAYVAGRTPSVRVELEGSRSRIRVRIVQNTPKLGGNQVSAGIGDTVGFRRGLLVVERAAKPEPVQAPGTEAEAIFDLPGGLPVRPEPEAAAPTTAAERRGARHAAVFAAGYHPITKERLHEAAAPPDDPDSPGRRCGNCAFRRPQPRRGRSFTKCLHPGARGADELATLGYPFASRSATTDVKPDWPACDLHSPGDPALSPDAARYLPAEGGRP